MSQAQDELNVNVSKLQQENEALKARYPMKTKHVTDPKLNKVPTINKARYRPKFKQAGSKFEQAAIQFK